MSTRTAAWFAWSVWGVALGFVLVGLLFGILAFSAALPGGREPMLIPIIVQGGLVVLYGNLGALIASRRRRNPIGWLFCALASALGPPLCCLRLLGLCPVCNRRYPTGRRAYCLVDELALHGTGVYRAVLPVPPFPRRAPGVAAVASGCLGGSWEW
jgi:hypothetical protein